MAMTNIAPTDTTIQLCRDIKLEKKKKQRFALFRIDTEAGSIVPVEFEMPESAYTYDEKEVDGDDEKKEKKSMKKGSFKKYSDYKKVWNAIIKVATESTKDGALYICCVHYYMVEKALKSKPVCASVVYSEHKKQKFTYAATHLSFTQSLDGYKSMTFNDEGDLKSMEDWDAKIKD